MYPFNAADEHCFSLEVTPSLLERIEAVPLSFEVMGHISHLTVVATSADDAGRQRCSMLAVVGGDAVMTCWQAHHLAAAERWLPYLSNYRAWYEVLELDDDTGTYEPVHTFTKPFVRAGAVLRLRQGSPRRLRIRLRHVGGARLNVSAVQSVTVVNLATQRVSDSAAADSYREADLELVKERFQQRMRECKMERDDVVRALLEKERSEGRLSPEDRALKERLMHEGEQMLYERDALYGSLVASGLPGVSDEGAGPEEGYEARLHVLYAPIGARAAEDLPPLAQAHWEASENDVDLRVLSQDIRHDDGAVDVVCAWDAAAHVDQSLSCVTADCNLVCCRVRIALEVDLAEAPVYITKLLCCRVVKRSANLHPSKWERLSSAASSRSGGTGLDVQLITGMPGADGGTQSEDSQVASSMDFDRRLRDVRHLAGIDRLEQTRLLARETQTPSRRMTIGGRGGVGSSDSTSSSPHGHGHSHGHGAAGGGGGISSGGGSLGGSAGASATSSPAGVAGRGSGTRSPLAVGGAAHLPALEQEINVLQRRLERARADGDAILVEVLHARLQDRFEQLAGPRCVVGTAVWRGERIGMGESIKMR